MSETAIRRGAGGELLLSGVLDYRSGPALREQGRQLIAASGASALVLGLRRRGEIQQRRFVPAARLHA